MRKCTLEGEGIDLSETGNLHAKTLLLLKPRGFCAGVVRAIDIVRIALEAFGRPIYVRKEIVHNRFVVEELQRRARFLSIAWTKCPRANALSTAPTGFLRKCARRA